MHLHVHNKSEKNKQKKREKESAFFLSGHNFISTFSSPLIALKEKQGETLKRERGEKWDAFLVKLNLGLILLKP